MRTQKTKNSKILGALFFDAALIQKLNHALKDIPRGNQMIFDKVVTMESLERSLSSKKAGTPKYR